jgi:tripartite-type tricarboxylate transporter receptor subunit TctC
MRFVLACCALLLGHGAYAQYPERPIKVVMPFPPGGTVDVLTRIVATEASEALGKPLVLEYKPGAGGTIATEAVSRAAPDGYTLLVCSSAFVVNPSLYANVTYDPFKEFSPLMVLGASPNVFTVPAKSDIGSLPDLIARAKANPGKINWTSSGVGTTPYLTGEQLMLLTGTKMVHIPFAGAGPASQAAVAAQVEWYTANLGSVQGLIDGKLLRPLAMTSKERWPELKDVPTLDELGIKGAESDTFQGVYAPAGTPQPNVDKIVKALQDILARPDVREKFAKPGLPVVAEVPGAFKARIAREVPMYKDIIDKAGLKIK